MTFNNNHARAGISARAIMEDNMADPSKEIKIIMEEIERQRKDEEEREWREKVNDRIYTIIVIIAIIFAGLLVYAEINAETPTGVWGNWSHPA